VSPSYRPDPLPPVAYNASLDPLVNHYHWPWCSYIDHHPSGHSSGSSSGGGRRREGEGRGGERDGKISIEEQGGERWVVM